MCYKYRPLPPNIGKNTLFRERSEIVWKKGRKVGADEPLFNFKWLICRLLTSGAGGGLVFNDANTRALAIVFSD